MCFQNIVGNGENSDRYFIVLFLSVLENIIKAILLTAYDYNLVDFQTLSFYKEKILEFYNERVLGIGPV